MTTRANAIETALRILAPAAPDRDIADIVEQACTSRGLKTASPQTAAWLSLVTLARHRYTDYDDLLADGYGVEAARHFCLEQIEQILKAWGVKHPMGGGEPSL